MKGDFYNSSIRRYILLMGDLFSRIKIVRQDANGNIQYRKVPITNASKEHFIMKLNSNLSVNNNDGPAKVESILPMIYLNLIDLEYNALFKTSPLNKSQSSLTNGKVVSSQSNPTPVKFRFEMGIYTRYQDDMYQIIEQIVPFFQPHFNTKITELFDNDISFERDIKVVLTSFDPDESLDGESFSRRRLEYSLFFELNGWIYPPVVETKGIIRTIYLDFYNNKTEIGTDGVFESIDYQVNPVDISKEEFDKTRPYISSSSENIPIPTGDIPPGVR